MGTESFEQLEVWQEAHKLVLEVYQSTREFPSEEKYGLQAQMRRAVISVPANIAEGFKRRSKADKRHFYNMAQASLEELRYYFILCRDLAYGIDYKLMREKADHVARMLHGLIRAISE
jgi:four helix bundle protein